MRIIKSLFRVSLLALTSLAVEAQGIRVVTEELPPFSMSRNGRLTGLSTEVVRAVLKEAGIDASIQSMPWARAYDLALHSENVLIYSLTRTPEREHKFKWVGVIAPTHWYLFELSSKGLKLNSLSDAVKYQIGTVNEDVGEQFLSGKGFAVGRNLQSSNGHELLYEKLRMGRIDFWISDEASAFYIVRKAGQDPNKILSKALSLPELDGSEGGMELAFSLQTPDATVQRVRSALAAIQVRGVYSKLLSDWR